MVVLHGINAYPRGLQNEELRPWPDCETIWMTTKRIIIHVVLSSPSHVVDAVCSIHLICTRATKTLIRLRECAVWSGTSWPAWHRVYFLRCTSGIKSSIDVFAQSDQGLSLLILHCPVFLYVNIKVSSMRDTWARFYVICLCVKVLYRRRSHSRLSCAVRKWTSTVIPCVILCHILSL